MQRHRHISAHPVLEGDYQLYTPNKETTRAHIRNTLEGLLLKPPVLAQKIIETLLEDLCRIKDTLGQDDDALSKYLIIKYFRNIKPEVQNKIFKTLWKLVFRLNDEKCNENRNINFRALRIIFNRRKEESINLVKENKDYFSQVEVGERLDYLISFLCFTPELYEVLEENARVLVEQKANNNKELFTIAWFLSETVNKHIELTSNIYEKENYFYVCSEPIRILYNVSLEYDCEFQMLNFMISIFKNSRSFDAADNRFEVFIKPYLGRYQVEHFIY